MRGTAIRVWVGFRVWGLGFRYSAHSGNTGRALGFRV
jgi:hypothetical protein